MMCSLFAQRTVQSGNMDWQCPTCSQWYITSGNNKIRTRHLRYHTREHPFDCFEPRCGESFPDTHDRGDHYRKVHSTAACSKRLECLLCGAHYERIHDLEMHVYRAKHPLADSVTLAAAVLDRTAMAAVSRRSKRFVCLEPGCGMIFTSLDSRLEHCRYLHTVLKKVQMGLLRFLV